MPKYDCGNSIPLPPATVEAYRGALTALSAADVPHVVGGAYALAHYTGVVRQTKDFDLFIRPSDRDRALKSLSAAGYRTEVVFPYWLGKAFAGEYMVDLIYRAPNGIVVVNDSWFQRAVDCRLFDAPVRVCAPEEILATKLFVLNNDRTDIADVMHLFDRCLETMDWDHMLGLLGKYWRVLLAQLVLFGFVYPSEKHRVPADLIRKLTDRLSQEQNESASAPPVCNGTLLSHSQYKIDIDSGRFRDGRLRPDGPMTPVELVDATISLDDPNRPRILRAVEGRS